MSLLSVKNLKMYYPVHGGVTKRKVAEVKAVDDVSFDIGEGQTLGLVGESGCGKSSLGKTIVRLLKPTSGSIMFQGHNLADYSQSQLRPLRRDIQMVFQDPSESLNSKMTVRELLMEPFVIHKMYSATERAEKVDYLLNRVGLPSKASSKYAFEFSGGQRQRIGIARALAVQPKLMVLDEPVSALDVSVQAQVLNLLMDLQEEFKMSYLFIAHDLSVVKHISDRVAVMYLGKIVEEASSTTIYSDPLHAYTKALIKSIPNPDPRAKRDRVVIDGELPTPIDPPEGSAFGSRISHPRYKETVGMDLNPVEVRPEHFVAPDPCCVENLDQLLSQEKLAKA